MSKVSRAQTIPLYCEHCGGPLPPIEEQASKPGALAQTCSPIRVYHPDGTLWLKIPARCERDRAAIRHVLAIDPAELSADAAADLVRDLNAWRQRVIEHHLLPGSKRRAKLERESAA